MKSQSKATAKTPSLQVINGGKSTITIPALTNAKRPEKHITADQLSPRPIQWVWWPRIPGGNMTIFAAKGGTGKGFMCADLVARITRGGKWPLEEKERASRGTVLWCEAEDSFEEVVIPRLIAAEADRSKVFLKQSRAFFKTVQRGLREFIEDNNVKLIVLSPLNSFLEGLKDPNHGLNVRKALESLQEAIEGTGCAIVGICHTNKKADLAAVDRILGSVEYVNFVRSVLLMARDADDATVRVVHGKSNLAPTASDIAFETWNTRPQTDPRGQYVAVDWSQPEKDVDPDHLFERREDTSNKDTASAGDWLFDYLRDGTWKDTKEIFDAGDNRSFEVSALKKAKQRSDGKIEHKREWSGGKAVHYWRLVTA